MRSDVLGHMMPLMKIDWAQKGVAELYTNIYQKGYKFLYLSSRSIGLKTFTSKYINVVKQKEFKLPEGPVILNPMGLFHAIKKEIIEKSPYVISVRNLKYKHFSASKKRFLKI